MRKAKDGLTPGQRIAADMPRYEYIMTKVRIPVIEFGTGSAAVQPIKYPSGDGWSLCRELVAGDYLVCVWIRPAVAK